MSPRRRDLAAARICLVSWLASMGFLAIGTLALVLWARSLRHDGWLWADWHEYQHDFLNAETRYLPVVAGFWLLVFILGAARAGAGRQKAVANGLSVAALATILLFCFLNAAPGLFANPIDRCTNEHLRTDPPGCLDCAIHRCEALFHQYTLLGGLLIVGILMAASLRLRWTAFTASEAASGPCVGETSRSSADRAGARSR